MLELRQEQQAPWYASFFTEEVYWRVYAPFLSQEHSQQEAEAIANLLELPANGHILDLACGTGRHAIALAQMGHRVTGLDQSPTLLQIAQDDASRQGVEISWICGDMRAIPYENTYDAIINVFSSFGYFERDEENQQVLHQVSRALRPGGRFLLETITLPRILHNFQHKHFHRYPDGLIVLEERSIDIQTNRFTVQVTLLTPSGEGGSALRRSDYLQSIRIYSLPELTQMCTSNGLSVEGYYGGLDGSPLGVESRAVLLCRKSESV